MRRALVLACLPALAGVGCIFGNYGSGDYVEASGGAGGAATVASSSTTSTGSTAGTGGGAGSGGQGGGVECGVLDCSWSKRIGDTALQKTNAVAVANDDGSVYVAGVFQGLIAMGNSSSASIGTSGDTKARSFLVKFKADGEPDWAHIGPPSAAMLGGDQILGLRAYGDSVLSTGSIQQSGYRDFFLRRDPADGGDAIFQTKPLGIATDSIGKAIAVSGDGTKAYVAFTTRGTGSFKCQGDTVEFTNTGMHTEGGAAVLNDNLVVAAFSMADGTCQWGFALDDNNIVRETISMAADGSDTLFISAAYSGKFTLGSFMVPDATNGGALVMKFDAKTRGFTQIAAFTSPSGPVTPFAVETAEERLFLAGSYAGTMIDANATQVTGPSQGVSSGFLVMLDKTSLAHQWGSAFKGPNITLATSLAPGKSGDIFVSGVSDSSLNVDGNIFACADGAKCMFLVRMSPQQAVLTEYPKLFGSDQQGTSVTSVLASSGDALVVGGTWSNSITFLQGMPLTSTTGTPNPDIVLAKLWPVP